LWPVSNAQRIALAMREKNGVTFMVVHALRAM